MGIPDIRHLITVEFEVFGHVQGKTFLALTLNNIKLSNCMETRLVIRERSQNFPYRRQW